MVPRSAIAKEPKVAWKTGIVGAVTLAAVTVLSSGSAVHASPILVSAGLQISDATSNPFSALVGKRREKRSRRRAGGGEVERYVLASDDRAFLFENEGEAARVTFLCGEGDPRLDCQLDAVGPAPEIYLLQPTRGPRGDMIYKNIEGETFLRIASYGGATVFWPGESRGFAASKSFGDDQSLRLPPSDFAVASRRAQAATAVVSALAGAPIIFDVGVAPSIEVTDATVLSDVVVRAANGVQAVADDPTGARIIASRINKVSFIRDEAPSIAMNEGVMEIRYVPNADIAGRPSTATIVRFLEETL